VLLAVHLGDELSVHDLVVLLPTGPARHLGAEGLGVGEHLVDVGVAADHHLNGPLGRPLADHVERPPRRPFGHEAVRVRLELGAAEIDVDDVAAVQLGH